MDARRAAVRDRRSPTQREKRARLAAAAIAEPANVVYAAIDFERTSLAAGLRAAGVDLDAPAFFSWLGVMVYLTRDAVDAVFRTVASMPAGSEIAFTFSQGLDSFNGLAKRVADLGEPLRTTIDVAGVEALLHDHGFREHHDPLASRIAALSRQARDSLSLPPWESIAAAIV